MQKECWKVTIKRNSWINDFCNTQERYFCLHYQLNKTTRPVLGRILCFNSMWNAYNFIITNTYRKDHLVIFKGFAENPIPQKFLANSDYYSIWTFWKQKKNKKKPTDVVEAPNGTMSAKSFTATKEYSFKEFEALLK